MYYCKSKATKCQEKEVAPLNFHDMTANKKKNFHDSI